MADWSRLLLSLPTLLSTFYDGRATGKVKATLHFAEACLAVPQTLNSDDVLAIQGAHWAQAGVDAAGVGLSCAVNRPSGVRGGPPSPPPSPPCMPVNRPLG